MYEVVRVSDNSVIEVFEDEHLANIGLFWYDTEDEPHLIINKHEE
jgi:hypothetical protein